MDFVQMLANAANSLSGITTQLVLAIAGVGGIALIILYLAGQGGRTRRGQRADSAGTFIAVLLLGCCIISIGSVVNAGANQFALGAVTFDAISYVPEGRYGPAAVAVKCRSDGPADRRVDICAQRAAASAAFPERWSHRVNTR